MTTPPKMHSSQRKPGIAAHRRGFTLTELLVVIAVILILASLLLPSLSQAKAKAYQARCISNLRQLSVAWQLYADDNNGSFVPNGYARATPAPGVDMMWVIGREHIEPEAFTNLDYLVNPQYALFARYIPTPGVYKCPSDRTTAMVNGTAQPRVRTYSLNLFFNWAIYADGDDGKANPNFYNFKKAAELAPYDASKIFTFVDTSPGSVCYSAFVLFMGNSGLYWHRPTVEHNGAGTLAFADSHVESHKWRDPGTPQAARTGGLDGTHFLYQPGNTDILWLQQHASVKR